MTGKKNSYDAAIIGGGPVGSQVAGRLAEAGYRTVVLEKKERLGGQVCCTGIVSRECVEAYHIPESVIYRWVNSASIFSPAGRVIRVYRDKPQAAILNRSAFNAECARQAQIKGAEYLFSNEVTGIETGKNELTLETNNHNNLHARAVIVTTGFASHLIDKLGLGGADDFVMGAQAEVETVDIDEVEVYFGNRIAPGFFAWLVPASDNKALVGLLSRRHPPAYLRSLLSQLVAEGKIVSADVPLTYGGVPIKPLPQTYGERLLVVGTAAGQVKPLTGGGIYFGLLSADLAANTLARALAADDLSSNKLAGYERSWKRRLNNELRTGSHARRFFEMLTDRQVDRLFAMITSAGLIDEMQKAEELTFDSHAAVVTRVLGQRLFFKAFQSMKVPFSSIGRTRKV